MELSSGRLRKESVSHFQLMTPPPKESQKEEGTRRGRGLRERAACDLKPVHPLRLDSSISTILQSQFGGRGCCIRS